jgi:hypothetical protein
MSANLPTDRVPSAVQGTGSVVVPPTSDPEILGALWNSSGSAAFSAGPIVRAWSATPGTAFDVTGTQGLEDFAPTSIAYTLSNDGDSTLTWTGASTDTWVSLSPASGSLASAATVVVTATAVQAQLAGLVTGTEPATITFSAATVPDITRLASALVNVAPETGWTDFPVAGDARVIYVSATGDNANDGLTTGTPKLTIAAGEGLMRSGFPDHLLLKRGDTFANQSLAMPSTKSGRSNTERMVFGVYGDEDDGRAIITTSANSQFFNVGFGAASHLAFQSLDISAPNRTGTPECFLWGPATGDNVTFEDLHIHDFGLGLNIRAAAGTNVKVFRCIINDCDGTMGLLATNVDGLEITECVVDSCGWEDGVTAASTQTRNVYVQSTCDNVVYSRNHSHRSSSNGAQIRPGGEVEDNLCVRNAAGIHFGFRYGAASKVGGCSGTLSRNVVLNSEDHDGVTGGQGNGIGNINATGVVVEGNLVANGASALGISDGFLFEAANNGFADQPILNMTMSNNVVANQDRPLRITGTIGTDIQGTTLSGNKFSTSTGATSARLRVYQASTAFAAGLAFTSNNMWSADPTAGLWTQYVGVDNTLAQWVTDSGATGTTSTAPSFTDATRGVDTYLDVLDATTGSTEVDFFNRLLLQRRGNWNPLLETTAVNAHIRAGFDLVPA